jgi:hypothetical protein
MNINDLNKSQFFLLILLVMFVTSVTTAIVTVTLLDKSPSGGFSGAVTQVVEKTIEKIVPGATTTIVKIIREAPLPNEGELIAQAVNKVSPSVVGVSQKDKDSNKKLGAGFVLSNDLVVTGAKILPPDIKELSVSFGKANLQADLISRDDNHGVAFFRINAYGTEIVQTGQLAEEGPTVGQTVVGLSVASDGSAEIATGIVIDFVSAAATSTNQTGTSTAGLIRTNAVNSDNVGGPIIDKQGKIVGIGIARGYALAADSLKNLIDQIK